MAINSDNWLEKLTQRKYPNRNGLMDAFTETTVSSKALNYYGWLEYVLMTDAPFSTVGKPVVLKYSNLKKISRTTFMNIFERLGRWFETEKKRIIAKVPIKRFGLIFDGWTAEGEHYLAVVLTWVEKFFITNN